jgi:hypothetical protein
MQTFGRRLTLTFSALIAGSAISLAVASPANATAADCRLYLADEGYTVGDGVKAACQKADAGGSPGYNSCKSDLRALGVSQTHTIRACDLGAK